MSFEFTERHAQLIQETYDKISSIEIVLKGYNGNPGLVERVESNTKAINKIWIVLAFFAGGGGVSFGIIKLLGG